MSLNLAGGGGRVKLTSERLPENETLDIEIPTEMQPWAQHESGLGDIFQVPGPVSSMCLEIGMQGQQEVRSIHRQNPNYKVLWNEI